MIEFIRKLPKRCNNSNYIPETGIRELPYGVNHYCLTIDNLIPDIKSNNTIPTLRETHNEALMSGTIIGYKKGRYNNQRSYGLKAKKDLSGLEDFYVL